MVVEVFGDGVVEGPAVVSVLSGVARVVVDGPDFFVEFDVVFLFPVGVCGVGFFECFGEGVVDVSGLDGGVEEFFSHLAEFGCPVG